MRKRRRFGSQLCATIATFAIWMAALISAAGFGSAALAQQAQTTGIVTFELFTGPDSVDLKPGAAQQLADAARRAQAPGQCPLGRFTIFVPEGDPMFQNSLGTSRRDVVLDALARQGIDPSRFFADVKMLGPRNDVQLDYDVERDQTAPKLNVTWTPPKGTKVKAGGKIKAKAVARDDTNRWQTGINTIDFDVQGGGSFGFHDYPRPQPPCERPPPPRTLEGVYTVPSDPPPIVRLRAVTKDFAGHDARDIAEFPTGDWYGTIDWSIAFPVGRMWGRLDLAFDYDGQGNLKGRMTGDDHVEAQTPCGPTTTETPSKLSANLVGQYTPSRNTMSLRLADQKFEQGQFRMCAIAPGGGIQYLSGQPFGGGGPLYQPGLAQLLNSLTVRADGSVEASGEWPVAPAEARSTLHMKLKLRRAQN